MRTRSIAVALAAAAALAGCSADTSAPTAGLTPGDASRTVWGASSDVVTEADVSRQAENTAPLATWTLYTRNAGAGAFVTGPATPPAGSGSFELTTPTSADKVTLFNFGQIGTRLSDIAGLGYSTYVSSAGVPQQVAALNLQVDVNGDAPGGFTTLVFEPVYNPVQGAVLPGAWQTWDAFFGGSAVWWSSNPIPGAPNRDTFVSWSTLVALNPNAVIVGGVGVNQGSGNPALVSAVDALRFESTTRSMTWNFEPFTTASSRDDCKNGGWRTFRRADGSSYRNQGECVADMSI